MTAQKKESEETAAERLQPSTPSVLSTSLGKLKRNTPNRLLLPRGWRRKPVGNQAHGSGLASGPLAFHVSFWSSERRGTTKGD